MSLYRNLTSPSSGSGYAPVMDTGEVRKEFQELELRISLLKESRMLILEELRMLRLEKSLIELQVRRIMEEVLVPEVGKRTSKGASVTKECQTDTGEVLEDQWFLKRYPCFLPTSLSKKEPIKEIEKYLENPTGRWSPDWDQPNNVTLTAKYERNLNGRWSPDWDQPNKKYLENPTGRQSPNLNKPNMSKGKMMPVGNTGAGESFSGNKFLEKGLGLCDTSQPEEELIRSIRKCMNMHEMLQHQAWINTM